MVSTDGRGVVDIGAKINALITTENVQLCHIFIPHTSAALMITGNQDLDLLFDVEAYFQRSVADANPKYRHHTQGDFDMSAHLRSILIGTEKTIPVAQKSLLLGKFQSLYLYENRAGKHTRKLIITLL
jgi:secondary thiamine-phosphate synthase enzyme